MVAYCTNIDLFYKYAMKSWKISVKETNLVTFANEVMQISLLLPCYK